jgi:hypothetical protein
MIAALMVVDEREVLVLALPADLIDPDVEQTVQTVMVELGGADAGDDPTDYVLVDPQHPFDCRLVDPRGQPGTRHSKSCCELRPWAGEWNALGTRPMLRAPQSPGRQCTSNRHTQRSRCRHTDLYRAVSLRAAVEYSHSAQTSRRRLSATSATTLWGSNRTCFTHALGRRTSLEIQS